MSQSKENFGRKLNSGLGTEPTFTRRGSMSASEPFSDISA
jgi:hypothetical protein